MDLLFKRYASPFVLIDNLILTSSSSSFIDDFLNITKDEKEEQIRWEFFLHKVFDKSWKEFNDEVNQPIIDKEIDLGATVVKSRNMLNNFTPESEV